MTSDPLMNVALASCLIIVLGAMIYALPMIIADYRHHPKLIAIWALNLFGSWTIVGWVVALVWSLTDNVREAGVGRLEPLVRKEPAESAMKKAV